MTEIKDANTAVGILVQAAEIANKQGVFSLLESKYIIEAIKFLNPNYWNVPDENENIENGTEDSETLGNEA